jgi:hypothetical protein
MMDEASLMLSIEYINQAGGVNQAAALLQLERALLAELEGCIASSSASSRATSAGPSMPL